LHAARRRVALRPGDAVLIARDRPHWFAPHDGTEAVALAIYTPRLEGKDWEPATLTLPRAAGSRDLRRMPSRCE